MFNISFFSRNYHETPPMDLALPPGSPPRKSSSLVGADGVRPDPQPMRPGTQPFRETSTPSRFNPDRIVPPLETEINPSFFSWNYHGTPDMEPALIPRSPPRKSSSLVGADGIRPDPQPMRLPQNHSEKSPGYVHLNSDRIVPPFETEVQCVGGASRTAMPYRRYESPIFTPNSIPPHLPSSKGASWRFLAWAPSLDEWVLPPGARRAPLSGGSTIPVHTGFMNRVSRFFFEPAYRLFILLLKPSTGPIDYFLRSPDGFSQETSNSI
jgi:hypothetical protein